MERSRKARKRREAGILDRASAESQSDIPESTYILLLLLLAAVYTCSTTMLYPSFNVWHSVENNKFPSNQFILMRTQSFVAGRLAVFGVDGRGLEESIVDGSDSIPPFKNSKCSTQRSIVGRLTLFCYCQNLPISPTPNLFLHARISRA